MCTMVGANGSQTLSLTTGMSHYWQEKDLLKKIQMFTRTVSKLYYSHS